MNKQIEELLPRVSSVIPESDYYLLLTFTNGETRRFNTKPLLDYSVYKSLLNNFDLVKVQYGTTVWPGDVDISPETLYLQSTPV